MRKGKGKEPMDRTYEELSAWDKRRRRDWPPSDSGPSAEEQQPYISPPYTTNKHSRISPLVSQIRTDAHTSTPLGIGWIDLGLTSHHCFLAAAILCSSRTLVSRTKLVRQSRNIRSMLHCSSHAPLTLSEQRRVLSYLDVDCIILTCSKTALHIRSGCESGYVVVMALVGVDHVAAVIDSSNNLPLRIHATKIQSFLANRRYLRLAASALSRLGTGSGKRREPTPSPTPSAAASAPLLRSWSPSTTTPARGWTNYAPAPSATPPGTADVFADIMLQRDATCASTTRMTTVPAASTGIFQGIIKA